MRLLFRIILCLPIIYSTSLVAQNSPPGGHESICVAHLYFAIGESSGKAKSRYQLAIKNYAEAGMKTVGVDKFNQMVEQMKPVANSMPDDTFWKMVKNCADLADTRFKGK